MEANLCSQMDTMFRYPHTFGHDMYIMIIITIIHYMLVLPSDHHEMHVKTG